VPGKKTMPNELNWEKRLKIKVSDPEIVDKGIFHRKYAVYRVFTHPFKYEVKRRYSDFDWLRGILIRDYPTCFIPPLPEKTQRSLEINYLKKRQEVLQEFIDSLVESEELRSSLHLLSFLKCTDEDQWGKIKAELNKVTKKVSVFSALLEPADYLLQEAVRRQGWTAY